MHEDFCNVVSNLFIILYLFDNYALFVSPFHSTPRCTYTNLMNTHHTNLINTNNLLPLCLLLQHLISPILQNIPILLFQTIFHVLHLLHPLCHEFIQCTTCRDCPIKQFDFHVKNLLIQHILLHSIAYVTPILVHVMSIFSIRLWKATSVDQHRNNLVLLTFLFFYFILRCSKTIIKQHMLSFE